VSLGLLGLEAALQPDRFDGDVAVTAEAQDDAVPGAGQSQSQDHRCERKSAPG